jgi:AP-1 complex subunit beta-1
MGLGGLLDFGMPTQQPMMNGTEFSNPFGQQEEEDSNAGAGWAADFGASSTTDTNKYTLETVPTYLKEVITNTTKGKDGKSGLILKAGFTLSSTG